MQKKGVKAGQARIAAEAVATSWAWGATRNGAPLARSCYMKPKPKKSRWLTGSRANAPLQL